MKHSLEAGNGKTKSDKFAIHSPSKGYPYGHIHTHNIQTLRTLQSRDVFAEKLAGAPARAPAAGRSSGGGPSSICLGVRRSDCAGVVF